MSAEQPEYKLTRADYWAMFWILLPRLIFMISIPFALGTLP